MRKKHKYSRRSVVNSQKKKIFPVIVISLLVFLALVVSALALGMFLKKKAELFVPRKDYGLEGNKPQAGDAPAVCAKVFNYGDNFQSHINGGYFDFSLSLGSYESLEYKSQIAENIPDMKNGEINLSELVSLIKSHGGRTCAYFYSGAFSCEDENLRRLKKAYEISVLREACSMGIDDILILGVNVTDTNSDEICEYLQEIRKENNVSVGIAVNVGVFMLSNDGVYTAGKLKNTCDYIAMDLRNLKFDGENTAEGSNVPKDLGEYLSTLKYYLSSYSPRLVFSEESPEFFTQAVDLEFENIQVVKNIK